MTTKVLVEHLHSSTEVFSIKLIRTSGNDGFVDQSGTLVTEEMSLLRKNYFLKRHEKTNFYRLEFSAFLHRHFRVKQSQRRQQ